MNTFTTCADPQPDVHPGNCWAFKGSNGFLVIRLSMRIVVTAVSLEHIPKALAPSGTLLSAPRDFSVYVRGLLFFFFFFFPPFFSFFPFIFDLFSSFFFFCFPFFLKTRLMVLMAVCVSRVWRM